MLGNRHSNPLFDFILHRQVCLMPYVYVWYTKHIVIRAWEPPYKYRVCIDTSEVGQIFVVCMHGMYKTEGDSCLGTAIFAVCMHEIYKTHGDSWLGTAIQIHGLDWCITGRSALCRLYAWDIPNTWWFMLGNRHSNTLLGSILHRQVSLMPSACVGYKTHSDSCLGTVIQIHGLDR